MIHWRAIQDRPGLDLSGSLRPEEIEEGRRYRHPGRHRQWQLGRAAAKQLLCEDGLDLGVGRLTPRAIWIHRMADGWPQARTGDGQALPVSLTIAHSGPAALAAACTEERGRLGIDLERVAPRAEAFYEDFYTAGERSALAAIVPSEHDGVATLYWVIKEAVLKARLTGLKEDAKSVEILSTPAEPGQTGGRARVRCSDGSRPEVCWSWDRASDMVLAVALFAGKKPTS